MRIIEVPPSKIGAPERGAIILPLKGPFIILSQYIPIDLTSSWISLVEKYNSSDVFTLILGTTVYQSNERGGISIAGYLHDTSD